VNRNAFNEERQYPRFAAVDSEMLDQADSRVDVKSTYETAKVNCGLRGDRKHIDCWLRNSVAPPDRYCHAR
jgi:hypothetical protein